MALASVSLLPSSDRSLTTVPRPMASTFSATAIC